jgi:hypothetical protein
VPQIDLSAQADRKMVNVYVYLRSFTKKSQFYTTDTQIKKYKTVILRFFFVQWKTKDNCPMHIHVAVYLLKKSQPEAPLLMQKHAKISQHARKQVSIVKTRKSYHE